MSTRSLEYRDRWLCYLDLLGFKNLVRTDAVGRVIPLYDEVLQKLEVDAAPKKPLGLAYSWFSDTFIIFSRGDSPRDFTLVEQAGRLFFQRLILAEIPVRGALTHGKLYSNLARNIFLGDALIDAYEYGEKQQWLGFLLAPNVYEKLRGTQLDVTRRLNYRRVAEVGVVTHPAPDNVYAYAFNNGVVNGQNPFLSAVRSMRARAGEQHRQKYENTEHFILAHALTVSSDTAT